MGRHKLSSPYRKQHATQVILRRESDKSVFTEG